MNTLNKNKEVPTITTIHSNLSRTCCYMYKLLSILIPYLLYTNHRSITGLENVTSTIANYCGTRFWKAPKTFRARKAIAKSRTLRLHRCFIHKFLIWTEVLLVQRVSGACTSPFLDADKLKMTLRTRKVSGFFEKRAPGLANRTRHWIRRRE